MKPREFWIEENNAFTVNHDAQCGGTHVREVLPDHITIDRYDLIKILADLDCSNESALKAVAKAFPHVTFARKGAEVKRQVDLFSCPKCKGNSISMYRFTQYRPKEGLVKCEDCEFFIPVKGYAEHVLARTWNAWPRAAASAKGKK